MAAPTQGTKPIDRWLALLGIAMTIAFFLVPKNPLIVVLSLIAIFALLFHPIWNFWWVERSLFRRALALTVVAALLFVFGVFVWPAKVNTAPSEGQSISAEWLARLSERWVSYILTLPWRWIVPSFVIGAFAVAVFAFSREKQQRKLHCPNPQLHQIQVDDKKEIKNLVKVCGVLCRRMAEGRQPVRLDFIFSILNMSLFNVSIDSIDGHITYHEEGDAYRPKLPPRLENSGARNLTFRRTGQFIIQQYFLTDAEADYILNGPKDTIFSLNTLKITVSGEGVEPTLLNNDIMVKRDDKWLDYHESYFFSSGMLAQSAGIELEIEIAALKAERDLLKSKLDELTKHQVIFEIDENSTQVRLSGGTQARRIEASVHLRFINPDINPNVIHVRAALYKQGTPDSEEPLLEHVPINLDPATMKDITLANGLKIDGSTQTPLQFVIFYMDISHDTEARLSPDHFIRITMKAMRQDDYSIDFYINNWREAYSSNSSIRLRRL